MPWWEHAEVVATFRKRCSDMLKEFNKRYQSPDRYYIACDCPRGEIWRLKLDPMYKSNRSQSNISKEGSAVWTEVFRVAHKVLAETFSNTPYSIVRADEAEADDCIAVCCDQLVSEHTDAMVHVVSGDSDLY